MVGRLRQHLPSAIALQDPTNSPLWTGKDSGLAGEDEHMAKFLKKFEGLSAASLSGQAGPAAEKEEES